MTDTIITGTGVFGWCAAERRTDRYGSFTLDKGGNWSISRHELADLTGLQASITVEVIKARESSHIGDLYHGIVPTKPEVGEVIDLGTGELFDEHIDWAAGEIAIGLKPTDGRDGHWFDPAKLYRLHDQTVRVTVRVTT